MGNKHGHGHGQSHEHKHDHEKGSHLHVDRHKNHFHVSIKKNHECSEKFAQLATNFHTLEDIQSALRTVGLESSNLLVAVDFTKSNTWTGTNTFGGYSLHTLSQIMNPYQQAIDIIGRTLEPFDDTHLIPAFGFGDKTTTDRACFPFFPDRRPCKGFAEVLQRYTEIVPNVILSGPTNFAPVIREAISIVKKEKSYYILVIIADGQVNNEAATKKAIAEASKYPISIIMVGVGDGPWDMMEKFDDDEHLAGRKFENFHFVPFYDTLFKCENPDVTFSFAALKEIPDQYSAIKRLGLLEALTGEL